MLLEVDFYDIITIGDDMKKGFTLAELMGVIVIISIIAILAFPPIINQIKKQRAKISDATMVLLGEATYLYTDYHKNTYPIVSATTYCITLQQLVDDNKLSAPIINATTGQPLALTQYVKMVINTKVDIVYTLVTTCP